MRSKSWLIVLASVVATADVAAQSAPSAVADLRPGQMVRVATAAGGRMSGRVADVDAAAGTLILESREMPFRIAEIDTLWKRGNAVRTGALIGGGIGLAGTAALTIWVCDVVAEGNGCSQWGTVALFTAGGGAVGALLGAGIGAVVPKWKRKFTRESLRVELLPGPQQTLQVGVGLRL